MFKTNVVVDENAVLLLAIIRRKFVLGINAQNRAVLDSACSSTVCGEN